MGEEPAVLMKIFTIGKNFQYVPQNPHFAYSRLELFHNHKRINDGAKIIAKPVPIYFHMIMNKYIQL